MSTVHTVGVDVAVIGAGPAGAAAAAALRRRGVSQVVVLERTASVGGVPSRYADDGVPTFLRLPIPRLVTGPEYASAVADELRTSGADTHLESTVMSVDLEARVLQVLSPHRGRYTVEARAIVCACGAREKTAVERGWIYGRRPARVYNSMPMLDLMRRGLKPLSARAALLGSRPAAYAMAAKLAAGHTAGRDCPVLDHSRANQTFLFGRLYFRRWVHPDRRFVPECVAVQGGRAVEAVRLLPDGPDVPVDYVLLAGDLVPNTELLAAAGVRTEGASWRIGHAGVGALAAAGVFLCGNICGGEHGAHRARAHGSAIAHRVAAYLRDGARPPGTAGERQAHS